ncbi:phosphonate metabolism protein PhnM [Nostoc linckia NIES-25]|nr:phosphonate metabolism protein PhnM [Nostoc linckia NIES-25]
MLLFTSNPAKAIHIFGDRGSLELGKLADAMAVHHDGIVLRLTATICQGRQVS